MNLEGDRTTMPEEGREPKRPQRTNGVLWGLFLIAIGGVFLYQRLFGNEFPRIWDLWPIVFLVIGTNQLLDRRPGSAVTWYVFAFIFFSVNFDWFGMTYVNAWPLFLVGVGLGIVIKALTGEERGLFRGGRRC